MSDAPNPKRDGPGVMAWRALYTSGLAILAALSFRVLVSIDAATDAVNKVNIQLSGFISGTTSELKEHDRRLGKLEDWRNDRPQR